MNGTDRISEADPPSPEFALWVDDQELTSLDGAWRAAGPEGIVCETDDRGVTTLSVRMLHPALGLWIASYHRVYPGLSCVEKWLEIENRGKAVHTLNRVDSVSWRLPPADYTLRCYSSKWGEEFSLHSNELSQGRIIQSTSGRSSNGFHPWFGLIDSGGRILTGAVVWSGNWAFRFEPDRSGCWVVSGGLHDWGFKKRLEPGESFRAPSVVLAFANGGDWDEAARQYHRWGREFNYRQSALGRAMPVEWNHWWPYEDEEIDEAVFLQNAERAADIGADVVTLDAGWFGPPDKETGWYSRRGDWDLVDTERFPRGIKVISESVRARGLKFGLWCEIEAVGQAATLAESAPELMARRDGRDLGYVCLGSPAGRSWAEATLGRLIREYALDWIKIDFNLDPKEGCRRSDHGHEPGEGLYAHYQGLYDVIERVRARFPHVLFEACSSGGLRSDLGMLRRFDCTFLSDPDYPDHALQVFWGALDTLAPDACLHWSWSQTRGAFPSFDPSDPALTKERFDFFARIGMLKRFGFSQRLPDLPPWMLERLAHHIQVYKERVARLVRDADVYRLTGQPRRDGTGERWCAFQYLLSGADRGALFVFRLGGGEPMRRLYLRGLDPEGRYRLMWDGNRRGSRVATGADLSDVGLCIDDLAEEESALAFLDKI